MSLPNSSECRFHGLELGLRRMSGARAVRVIHPAGQRIGEHRHDWPLLTLPRLGSYDEEGDDGSVALTGRAVVFHPAGHCHANCIHAQGMETVSIEFDPAWLGLNRSLLDRSRYWVGGDVALASRQLANLWSESLTPEPLLRSKTRAFVRSALAASARPQPSWFGWVMRRVATDAPDVGVLARELGMHPGWLTQAYRRAAGEGLHESILRRRLEDAVQQLRLTDAPIAEIAADCGFCDQSHLNRATRRLIGRTPAQIRAERVALQGLVTRDLQAAQ